MSSRLFDSLGTTEPLAEVFSDESVLAAMLRFEVALARAEAGVGVIPEAAARCDRTSGRVRDLRRGSHRSGGACVRHHRHSVRGDADRARVAASAPDAAAFVHRGATSQDVTDTALVLCLVRAGRDPRAPITSGCRTDFGASPTPTPTR